MFVHRQEWLIAAVSLTLAGAAYGQDRGPANDQPRQGGETAGRYGGAARGTPASDRARVAADTATTPVSETDLRQIHESMARIVDNGTKGGAFDDFIREFSGGTRRADPGADATAGFPKGPNRANATEGPARQNPGGPGAETDASRAPAAAGADLEKVAAQFSQDWKARYNTDFKPPADVNQLFNDSFASINTSDLGDAAQTAGASIPPTVPTDRATPRGAAPNTDATHIDNRAVIIIQAGHGAPMTTVTLINAGAGNWRVDAPQGVNDQNLRASVARHLNMLERDKANWPSDPSEAYRAVAHHVFLAISDAGAGLMQGGSVVQPGDHSGNNDVGTGVNTGVRPGAGGASATPRR